MQTLTLTKSGIIGKAYRFMETGKVVVPFKAVGNDEIEFECVVLAHGENPYNDDHTFEKQYTRALLEDAEVINVNEPETAIHLKGIGPHRAKKMKDFKVGDILVWDWVEQTVITDMKFSASGKTVTVTHNFNGRDGSVTTSTFSTRADKLYAYGLRLS